MHNVLVILQEVFRDVFDDHAIVLNDNMSALDFDEWDSLQHINIIIATERRMNIRFTTSEISRLKQPNQNIGTFVKLLEEKINIG